MRSQARGVTSRSTIPVVQFLRSVLLVCFLFSINCSTGVSAPPQITSVDENLLPVGGTVTVTGSGFTGTTAVYFLPNSPMEDYSANFNVVSDTTLEVTMPDIGGDQPYLVIETPNGTAIGVPDGFQEHTINGPALHPGFPFEIETQNPVVVKAGGILTGRTVCPIVFVETGGTFFVDSDSSTFLVIAEPGAAIDFTNAPSPANTRFYYTPSTIVVGNIPIRLKFPPPFVTSGISTPDISVAYGVHPIRIGQPINRTIVGDGTIDMDPDQAAYTSNTSVTLTGVPGPDHTFSGWSGDIVSTDNPLQVQTSSNPLNITATFSPGWTLTIRDSTGGTVNASPAANAYGDGEVVTLTATPSPGFEFLQWIGDLSGTSTQTTITMDAHQSVIPVFRPIGYDQLPQITGADSYIAPVGGTVTLTGSGLADTTAVHLFSGFAFQDSATFSLIDANSLEFTMPDPAYLNQNYTLIVETASGSTIGLPAGYHEHTVIGPAVNEGGLPLPGPFVVRPGAVLNGTSVGGTVVVQAGGTLEVESSGISLIIAEDGAIVDFTKFGGSILPARLFHSPNTVILGDVPGSPPGPGTPPGSPITTELPSIATSLDLAPFNLGYAPDITIVGDGSVSISPAQNYYLRGQAVQLTAVPAAGKTFSGWTGDVTSPGSTIDTHFSSNGVLQLTATFSTGWVLTMADSPGGSVAASPDKGAYANNEVVNLSATPDSGFSFFGWTGDLTGTDPVTDLTMDSHKSIAPLFRVSNYEQLPQVTGADRYSATIDGTITLTGSGFTGTTAVTFFANWQSSASAAFTIIDDNTLEVAMPDLPGDTGHYMIIETTTGSTITVPGGMHEHTGTGPAVDGIGFPIITPIVVRPGATLSGDINAPLVVVETGGTLEFSSANYGTAVVVAEDAAVIDFSNFTAPFCRTRIFHSPATVIVGTPPGLIRIPPVQPFPPSTTSTTSLKPSPGLDQFNLAVTFTPNVEGPGSVAVNPQQSSYASGTEVTVTATPNPGAYFIRWIGSNSSQSSPITLRVRKSTNLTARFSLSPDYFTTWRPEHFTTAELSDLDISGLDADPDGDLLTNAAEYAFGSDPRSASGNKPVEMMPVSDVSGTRIHASYVRPKDALDVDYRLLVTSDFATWNENGDASGVVYSREIGVESVTDELEKVTLELYPDDTPPAQIFLKLTATIF